MSCQVESTLLRIGFCRTAALKGRIFRCPNCNATAAVYNSCGDRHGPQCQGARRADWVDKTAPLLRAGINYFHVIFTLPDRLSGVVLGNRRLLYGLLFRSAARALEQSLLNELRCAKLQPSPPTTPEDPWATRRDDGELPPAPTVKCPHCGATMDLESDTCRPSWRELLYGPEHPSWVEWKGSG